MCIRDRVYLLSIVILLAGLPILYRYILGRVTYFLSLYFRQGYLLSIVILLAGLPTFYCYNYCWQGYLFSIVILLAGLPTFYRYGIIGTVDSLWTFC